MSFIVLPIVYYLNVNFIRLMTSVEEERATFLLSITRKFVISVRMSFLFL